MIITKKALPRRTVLRGMGAMLTLPMLDAMLPALTPTLKAATNVRRLAYFYEPCGTIQDARIQPSSPTGYAMPEVLKTLEPVRKQTLIFSGLANREVLPNGDGNGNHPRACAGWLSGVHIRKTEGADIQAGITVDQVAALAWANETRLPSLEIGLDTTQVIGNCDSGYSCLYMTSPSWRSATEPLQMEANPAVVFERMFGDASTPAERRAQLRSRRSLLDSVLDEFRSLRNGLGPADRLTVDAHLDAVREVERRIARAEAETASGVETMGRPLGIPRTFADHANLMIDLMVLAYRADITRVINFQIARESSTATYPEIGVREGHHGVSHHGRDPQKLDALAKIKAYHISFFAEFAKKLQASPEGSGSILDNSLLLWGAGLGDPDQHNPFDLHAVMVGGAAAGIKGDRYLRYDDQPLANLLLTMLDKSGIHRDSLGDSTGRLTIETNTGGTLGGV